MTTLPASASTHEPAGQPGATARPRVWRPFTRESRLRNRQQLQLVHAEGKSRAGRFVVVKALPAPDGQPRVAIIISRRFSTLAVERNRARRLLREAVRQMAPGIQPCWFLFLPRQPIKKQKLAPVAAEVLHFGSRLGIWQPPPPPPEAP
ncbi:MAG: ribonuclease P protein component [Lentisphaeria bacterium]